MTKKDYKLIAEAFKIYNYLNQPTRYFIAMALSERLEKDNPRFDRDLFLESCDLFHQKPPKHSECRALALWLPIESVSGIC